MVVRKRFQIHADESSQSGNHQFMAIGSILSPFSSTIQLEAALSDALLAAGHKSAGEVKWGKLRKHNLDAYKAFMARLFDELEAGRAFMNVTILDRQKLKNQKFNAGDGELGFTKFLYQHLLKYARLHIDAEFYAFPDSRTTVHNPSELRRILNAGAIKKRYTTHEPFNLVQFKDSCDSRIIQAVDMVIGCIAWVLNERGSQPDSAAHRQELAAFIQMRKPLVPTFDCNTAPWKRAFNIWHFELSE
jgi:hypothetical protein